MKRPYLHSKTVKGVTRWYVLKTWREDGRQRFKYWPIKADPDTAEFDSEYWRLRSGMDERQQAPSAHTWADLIKAYRMSPRFLRLKPETKRVYNRMLERLLDSNGGKDVRRTTRAGVRAIQARYAETPGNADKMVAILSLLLEYAVVELDWIDKNPAKGIEQFGTQNEREAWPESLQRAFVNACKNLGNTDALTAYMLGTGTGQRARDFLKMEWDHYDGVFISVKQNKTGTRLDVACPMKLRAYLNSLPRDGKHILARDLKRHKTYDQMQKAVQRICKKIGADPRYTMHGWRYTAAVELAEAGATDAEIQSVTGHKTLDMVKKYRGRASQRRLSKAAQERRKP